MTYDEKVRELASRVGEAEGRAAGLEDELYEARRTAAEQLGRANERIAELEAECRRLLRRAEAAEAARDELDGIAPRTDYEAGRRRARLLGAGR